MDSSFDVAIIGTSPVLLIEAIGQSAQNKRVVLIERRAHLGGAWYTKKLWDSVTVEVGCHYIERSPHTYSFITDVLGVELAEELRHLVWHSTNSKGRDNCKPNRTNMPLKQTLGSAARRLITGHIFSRNLWNVLLSVKHRDITEMVQSANDYITARQYYYPSGGFRMLLDALHRQIEMAGITLLLNTAVHRVEAQNNNGTKLTLANDQLLQASKVIVGQQANVAITINGQPLEIPRQRNRNIHILYHVRGDKAHPFGYLDIAKNRYLRRISDITEYSDHADGFRQLGERLICCHVQKDTFDHEQSPATLFAYLRDELKLLTPDSQLLKFHIEEYHSDSYIDRTTRKKLEAQLPPSIEILYTYDLGKAIDTYSVTRWSSMANRDNPAASLSERSRARA